MTNLRRPSPQTIAVLLALAEAPATWRYGYELGQQVALKAGSMYPILMRLAERGLLETAWETDPPPGRPPRHLYRLTGSGLDLAAAHAGLDPTITATKAAPARKRATARPRPKRA
jgi:DNA-binding PadR family transcriptional regulator